jgi:predicted nucleic acid-binding protein
MFGEAEPLAEWGDIERTFASRILAVELGRVVERARTSGRLDDAAVEQLHAEARRMLPSIDVVGLTEPILRRAAGPMPTTLGPLDAIHLATALEIAPALDGPLVVATHDRQLARAARASGFEVVGS